MSESHLFTCLACSIAFTSPVDQSLLPPSWPLLLHTDQTNIGDHYRSDYHRYNMKRRVASLPPISIAVFNEKVRERKTETAVMSSAQGPSCEVCKLVSVFP